MLEKRLFAFAAFLAFAERPRHLPAQPVAPVKTQ
ncbi:MAG: hypothetical protein QOJ16_2626 [Acidobacteriota bacterium]|jgi:hypothetical protein|nr:hypothetical protein [Acidobacteriota bacterium]